MKFMYLWLRRKLVQWNIVGVYLLTGDTAGEISTWSVGWKTIGLISLFDGSAAFLGYFMPKPFL